MVIEMEFSNVQNLVEEPYRRLGFMDQWEQVKMDEFIEHLEMLVHRELIGTGAFTEIRTIKYDMKTIMDIAEVGLFGEELGELLDAIRKGERLTVPANDIHVIPSIGEECADLAIRLMNFCNRKKINLEKEILKKNEFNKRRSYLHDKKA